MHLCSQCLSNYPTLRSLRFYREYSFRNRRAHKERSLRTSKSQFDRHIYLIRCFIERRSDHSVISQNTRQPMSLLWKTRHARDHKDHERLPTITKLIAKYWKKHFFQSFLFFGFFCNLFKLKLRSIEVARYGRSWIRHWNASSCGL